MKILKLRIKVNLAVHYAVVTPTNNCVRTGFSKFPLIQLDFYSKHIF